ncbi:MAG TPA: phosphate-starvation-inducible PsiE family protein [Nitrospira sp.]|nr:phosphate-starvation-inducible PsiE family protein [Nitrospira sp.]HPV83876.1 phosphate-starvation-inducible PsiE family protein [Nitrospira sp.]
MTFSSYEPRMQRWSDFVGRMIDTDLSDLWMKGIKAVLSLMILTILIALTGGVMKTFLDIGLLLHAPVEVGLRQIIIDTLILLAVVEVFKTTLTYFSEGRVKVTFIVDTILVVMLTEIISLWFKDADQNRMLLLGAILLMLGVVRVVAVRCSPAQGECSVKGVPFGREEG